MTNVELSKRAGVSAPPCLRRVRVLEKAGVIRGYHADTDPQKVGWISRFSPSSVWTARKNRFWLLLNKRPLRGRKSGNAT